MDLPYYHTYLAALATQDNEETPLLVYKGEEATKAAERWKYAVPFRD